MEPGIVQKSAEALTQDDMVFTLRRQLEGLVAKEMATAHELMAVNLMIQNGTGIIPMQQ